MRITGIEIERFGVWQNYKQALNRNGLTVFYGPNEAGKTTLLRFIRGLLYGYPPDEQLLGKKKKSLRETQSGLLRVEHHGHERQLVLHGSGEFLPVHQEIAIAIDGNDGAAREQSLHGHGGGNAIAHGCRDRRDMRAHLAEAVEAMNPGGVISRAVAENGVLGQVRAQPGHDARKIDRTRLFQRHAGPGEIILMRRRGGIGP